MSAEPARLPAPARLGERGFTLLETLVALAILGIVLVTLFRFAGDTLAQYRGREARLGLALTAEAAFNAERLEPGSASGLAWPAGLVVTVERRDLAGSEALAGLGDLGTTLAADLDWLGVVVMDGQGRRFSLEGAVGRPRS
jgi:prepilin-type N-terminal cleavage/methylation domain-containing protein